jgi:hypothetical protein
VEKTNMALETILIVVAALLGAAVSALATFLIQERKLRREFKLDRENIRTDFMAEQVARQLLESEKWVQRSFAVIKQRLSGFEDNELRKILVRAGAVRFGQDKETWGLLSRNKNALE